MYGLHAFSALMGVLGPMFIVTAFLTGWPSIIAIIINYVKRADVRGTYLDSHFGWQLRTFWYAVLGVDCRVCSSSHDSRHTVRVGARVRARHLGAVPADPRVDRAHRRAADAASRRQV